MKINRYNIDKVRRRVLTAADMSLRYASEPRLRPAALPIGTWWWDGKPNFGDRLTDLLLPNYGIAPYHASRNRARLFGVGSTIDASPPDYDGYFWGTGKYVESDSTPRKLATFLAVRGPLTRDVLELPEDIALGDPGLLVSKHIAALPSVDSIGVVPHFTHASSPEVTRMVTRLGAAAHVIDVRRPTVEVVRRISRCSAVISTSLHGLITADAYGIPALWAMPQPSLTGGDFKFRDYEAVVKPDWVRRVDLDSLESPEVVHRAAGKVSADAVRTAQDELEAALQILLDRESVRVKPQTLPLHVGLGIVRQW